MRSGFITIRYGFLQLAGTNSYNRTSRATNLNNAFFLQIGSDNNDISLSGEYNRLMGYPVRCLASGA